MPDRCQKLISAAESSHHQLSAFARLHKAGRCAGALPPALELQYKALHDFCKRRKQVTSTGRIVILTNVAGMVYHVTLEFHSLNRNTRPTKYSSMQYMPV